MKNILFLIMLMPLFTVGQNAIPTDGKATPAYFRIDSNGVITDIGSNKVEYDTIWSKSGIFTWEKGNGLYRTVNDYKPSYDTIKVKALVTTGANMASYEMELLEVIEIGWYGVTLAIYPPPSPTPNKYLTTDKKPLPKTVTVWMAKPIN